MEYAFQLSDFFNYYVASNQTSSIYDEKTPVGFYDSINMKREFSNERPKRIDNKPTSGDMLLPHQRFMQRFFSPYTPYDRLLVFHGLGTGKTCLYTAVAEFAKKENPNMGHVIILVRSEGFVRNVIKEISQICTCTRRDTTGRNCIDGPYIAKLTPLEEKEDREEIDKKKLLQRRTNALIGKTYDIMTFGKFAEKVYRSKQDGSFDDVFHNTYVIIDEAHNVKETKKEGSKKFEGSVYKQIWDFCHTVKGCKIMLLSGTPMRDKVFSEFVGVANLLLPIEEQLTIKQVKNAFTPEGQLQDKKLIASRMRTRVSYLRSMVGKIAATYMGSIVSPLQYTKVVATEMDEFQGSHYYPVFQREARLEQKEEEDEEEEQEMKIWHNSIFASSFVFPDGSYGIQAEASYITLYDTKGDIIDRKEAVGEDKEDAKEDVKKVRVEGMDIKKNLKDFLEQNGMSVDSRLSQLRRLSCKFATILEHILTNRNKKTFVYSRYVNGAGCLLLGALLTYFGFERANSSNIQAGPKPRFTIITNETNTAAMSSEAIDIFNHEHNLRGELCQVMIGSHVVGEGFSFESVRSTFVLSPYWNTATLDQAIGRTVRNFSHDRLPESERRVDVYMLAAMYQGTVSHDKLDAEQLSDLHMKSIDIRMYKKCEWKDVRIKQIERVLKEVAVDCVLNRERNILEIDQPGSKACDYMDVCNYTCTEVTDLSLTQAGTIEDTYNLYYADNEIALIILSIQGLFKRKSAYDFEELYEKLMVGYDRPLHSIVLARALYEMVSKNTEVRNRHGFKNYVRSDRNMFFLVDDPTCGSLYWNGTYADHPQPNITEENFNSLYMRICNQQYGFIIDQLQANVRDATRVYYILQSLPLTLFHAIMESVIRDVLKRETIRKHLQEAGELTEEDKKELALSELSQVLYDRFKDSFERIVQEGEEYMVNKIITSKQRVAKIADLLNPELSDEEVLWAETGGIVEMMEEKRQVNLEVLHANPLRYYATIERMPKIDKKSGNDQSFRIKWVHMPRYVGTGQVDKRKDVPGGGAVCGTEEYSNRGIMRLVVDLSMRMKKLEEANVPLITNMPPFVNKSMLLHPNTLTVANIQGLVQEMQPGFSDLVTILLEIAKENVIKSYLEELCKDLPWKDAKENLLQFATTVANSALFKADKSKVVKSYGEMKFYQEKDKLITMLAENEWVSQYISQLPKSKELFAELEERKEKHAVEMLSVLTGIPASFFETDDLDVSSKKQFIQQIKESRWDGKYLLSLSQAFSDSKDSIINKDYCAKLKKYFMDSGLFIYK
jgi:hypothetical protein